MFDIDKLFVKRPDFKELNDNQYVALFIINNGIREYLVDDKTFKPDFSSADIKKKKDLLKLDSYLEIIDQLGLQFEECDAYMSSEECDIIFKQRGDTKYNLAYFPETDEWYDIKDGMTKYEKEISEMSVEINNTFRLLPQHHPQHVNKMVQAMTDIQHLLQSRACHRLYPAVYPIYRKDDK